MPQPKKRPSKKAKAAQKILEKSELLATVRTNNELNSDEVFNSNDSQIRTSDAKKLKPHKKRG